MDKDLKKLLDQYPFLSFLTYGGNEYIGIVQNSDQFFTNFYDYGRLISDHKARYLELGEQWWWESNRLIPINIFLKSDWVNFRYCLKTLNTKDVNIAYGPRINLRELANKRVKRRSKIGRAHV